MIKNNSLKTMFYILLSLMLFSCDKNVQEILDGNTIPNDKSYLTIKDNEELVFILNQLDNGNKINSMVEISNFISMWNVYDSIVNGDIIMQNDLMEKSQILLRLTKIQLTLI